MTLDMPELSKQLCELMYQEQEPPIHEVRELLEQGANPNHRPAPNSEQSTVHIAARYGHCKVLRLMAERGAKMDAISGAWKTPLMMAAQYNQTDAMKLLLELGADPLYINAYGHLALDEAAASHALDALKLLLEGPSKALISHHSKASGQTPLHHACNCGAYTPLAMQKLERAIDLLLEAGADATALDSLLHTPLMDAVGYHAAPVVEKLLPISGDVNRVSNTGKTALFLACYANELENVQLLLNAGADVNQCDALGDNCIVASLHGTPKVLSQSQVDLIRLLADCGADVNHRNVKGKTPLMEAISTKRTQVSTSLLPGTLILTILDLGAHIDEEEVTDPLIHERAASARTRYDALMRSGAPAVQQISSQDLIWFSNINLLGEVLKPCLWRGHEAHLKQVLAPLPPALIAEVMEQQAGLAELISQPDKKVSDWCYQACTQMQKEHRR